MLPNLPSASAPSIFYLRDINYSPAERPPSHPPLRTNGEQPAAANTAAEGQVSDHSIYAVVKHRSQIPAGEQDAVTKKKAEYAAINVSWTFWICHSMACRGKHGWNILQLCVGVMEQQSTSLQKRLTEEACGPADAQHTHSHSEHTHVKWTAWNHRQHCSFLHPQVCSRQGCFLVIFLQMFSPKVIVFPWLRGLFLLIDPLLANTLVVCIKKAIVAKMC